jgi:hypothetical protein
MSNGVPTQLLIAAEWDDKAVTPATHTSHGHSPSGSSLPIAGGRLPRKGGVDRGEVQMPSGTHGRQTWAENRTCPTTHAVHA